MLAEVIQEGSTAYSAHQNTEIVSGFQEYSHLRFYLQIITTLFGRTYGLIQIVAWLLY